MQGLNSRRVVGHLQRLLPLVRTLYTAIAGNPHGYWLCGLSRWTIFSKVGRFSPKWYDFQRRRVRLIRPQPPESGTIFRGWFGRLVKVVRFSASPPEGKKNGRLGRRNINCGATNGLKWYDFQAGVGQFTAIATASAAVAVNVALPRQMLNSESAPASFSSRAASFSRRENSLSSGTSGASP